MKELSIEEKAKAYDEAIEKFDVILNLNTVKESGTIFVDDVRKILPELKESEDERIELLNYLYDVHDDDEERARWIAWLEAQGEQKPAWSEEDKVMLDKVIERLHKHSAGDKEYLDIYYWLIALKDRVQPQPKQEWKPSDEQIKVCKEVYADILSAKGFDLGTINNELNRMEEELKKLREK